MTPQGHVDEEGNPTPLESWQANAGAGTPGGQANTDANDPPPVSYTATSHHDSQNEDGYPCNAVYSQEDATATNTIKIPHNYGPSSRKHGPGIFEKVSTSIADAISGDGRNESPRGENATPVVDTTSGETGLREPSNRGNHPATEEGFSISVMCRPYTIEVDEDPSGGPWYNIYSNRTTGSSVDNLATISLYRKGAHLWLHYRTDEAARVGGDDGASQFPADGHADTADMLKQNCFVVGQWIHIIAGRNASGAAFWYINGIAQSVTASAGPGSYLDAPISNMENGANWGMGQASDGTPRYPHQGDLRNARFHNEALNSTQAMIEAEAAARQVGLSVGRTESTLGVLLSG